MLPFRPEDLKKVLLSAGEELSRAFQTEITARRKADGSFITETDEKLNDILKRGLSKILPGAGWISEEDSDDPSRLTKEWTWIVDPLDGTKEFVRRTPEFAISVGLAHHGEAVLGAVLNPVSGEGGIGYETTTDFWGFGQKIAARATTLKNASAGISRTEFEDGSVLPYVHLFAECRRVGSIAYKLLRVAKGVEDMTLTVQSKSEWDVCGGVALLRAAGLTYERFDGVPLKFNQPSTRISSGAVGGPKELVGAFIREMK